MRTQSTHRGRTPRWPPPAAPRRTDPTPAYKRHAVLGRILRVLGILLVLALLLLGIGAWRLTATVTSYSGAHFNHGQNAVWLEHEWSGEPHSAAGYDQLAQRLTQEQISYVFAHVGPLQSDGTIPPSLAPNAADFVTALHQRMPHVHVLAWIGQVEIAGGYPADESVNLGDSMVRQHIAQTAAHFVKDLGFDGVHYDIEPIINNNPRFLDLLDETRTALPSGAILSVVGEKWAPNAHAADLLKSKGRGGAWWTTYYYAAVAAHVNQITPMLYDTGMPTAQLYQLFVKQETTHILDAVRSAAHPPQVLIGVPTYSGNNFWFHQGAENMRTSLTGIVDGLNSNRDTSAFVGVAVYRFGVTSDADWTTYDHLWLGK